MRSMLIAMMIVSLTIPTATAMAEWGMGMGRHHMYDQQQSYDQKDLEAQQKLYREYSKKVYPMIQKMQSYRFKLQAELLNEKIDEKAVDDFVGKINQLRDKIFSAQIEYYKSLAKQGLAYDAMCPAGMGMGGFGMGMMGNMMMQPGMMYGYGGGPGMGPGMMYGYGPYYNRPYRYGPEGKE